MNAKERSNIKVLQRRKEYLDKKIEESEIGRGYNRWERRALVWVLNLVESNNGKRN